MKTNNWPRAAIFSVPHAHNLDSTTESRERTIFRANSMRSAANIRIWRSYLPEDCVNTMIKMGWDQTT
jgi:hypothetical protein